MNYTVIKKLNKGTETVKTVLIYR